MEWINKDNWDYFLPLEISKKKGRGLVSNRKIKKSYFSLFCRGKRLAENEYQSQMVTSDNEYLYVNRENKLDIEAKDDPQGQ